jgi:hypothetical protein
LAIALALALSVTQLTLTLSGNPIALPIVLSLPLPVFPLPLVFARVCRWGGWCARRGGNRPVGKLLRKSLKLILIAQSDSLVSGLELIQRLADVVEFVDLCVDWN